MTIKKQVLDLFVAGLAPEKIATALELAIDEVKALLPKAEAAIAELAREPAPPQKPWAVPPEQNGLKFHSESFATIRDQQACTFDGFASIRDRYGRGRAI